jgi:hypothetical protein
LAAELGDGDELAEGLGVGLALGLPGFPLALGLALGIALGLALGEALGLALGLALGFALGLALGEALGLALGLALAEGAALPLGDGCNGNCPTMSVTPRPRSTSLMWLAKVVVLPPANSRPTAFVLVRSKINEPESPASLNARPPSPEIVICPLNVNTPLSYCTFTSVSMLLTCPVV